jgi:RNA polymerase sigma factor (TIGR02999 family)
MTEPDPVSSSPITLCFQELRQGDQGAFERLVTLLYDDLRMLARAHLGGRGPQTLTPTALVHEAYMRLSDRGEVAYADRSHFLAVCSVVMRNIVIDFARRRKAQKRGGDRRRVTLNESMLLLDDQAEDLIAIDQALTRMQELSPRMVRVVECRFFGGLTEGDTAGILGVSESTVRREWVKARALLRELLGEAA